MKATISTVIDKAVKRGKSLRHANLSDANLSDANLRCANLSSADLSYANLTGANLSSANLSSATGLLSAVEYMNNFERAEDGYIVYKTFGTYHVAPDGWTIAPGSVITEVCNPSRATDCGCGVNFGTAQWVRNDGKRRAWKCLIRWEWAAGIVVPYHTDGKARCERLELVEEVDL